MKIKINGRAEEIKLSEARDTDRITACHTAFPNFSALVNAEGGYRPSIYLGGKSKQVKRELLSLTAEYNEFQSNRKDSRRIYCGDFEFVFVSKASLNAKSEGAAA
jgi:hypothetical protein